MTAARRGGWPGPRKPTLTTRPPAELDGWLRDYAERTGRSLTDIVTAALAEYRVAHDQEGAVGSRVTTV